MASKLLRFAAYSSLFALSFLLFLYWFFPYDALEERIASAIEQRLGSWARVEIGDVESYWFTGLDISGLSISEVGPQAASAPLVEFKRVRGRAAILSLLFGEPDFSFGVEIGDGEISGSVDQSKDFYQIDVEMDDVDIGAFKFLAARSGLTIESRIEGEVILRADRRNPLNSAGKVSLTLRELKSLPSNLKLGAAELPVPALSLAKGRDSQIKLEIGKGAIAIEAFKLGGEDLGAEIKGKVALSARVENYRLNLSGSFTPSKKLADTIPFFNIVEKQRQQDGSYPLSIAGKLTQPVFKVGTFPVPNLF